MPYNFISLNQAVQELSNRLYDRTQTFWSSAELQVYIVEALRTFNALTGYWRDDFILNTVEDQLWYDISSISDAPNTIRPVTVTDVDVVTAIEYHLLEPPTGVTWTGSLQFNINDLLQAIARRRDEVLSGCGITLTESSISATPGRKFLPDSTIDIRRIAWMPIDGFGYTAVPMWADDQWELQSYNRDYTIDDPGVPATYRQSTEPPLSFDVSPPPIVPGSYDVLTVNAGVALSIASPNTLSVPNDWVWLIKWGALADLMGRDSLSHDALRQKYCEMRYQQGMKLMFDCPALLAARIVNLPLNIDAVQNNDNFDPNWQAADAGQPDTLLTAGLNLIVCSPVPDAGPYSITLTVVRNAPIPTIGSDALQMGKDELDVILDYSQHLALFKSGGTEFIATLPLLQRFYTQCALYGYKLKQLGDFQEEIYSLSQLQSETNPVFSEIKPPYAPGDES